MEPIFCPEHGNFPNKEAFAEHVAKVHPEMVAGQDAINKVKKVLEEQSKPHSPTLPPPPQNVPSQPQEGAKPTASPIVLEYKFTGGCPVCIAPVDTLYMEVGRTFVCIAWCNNCRKSIKQQKVQPLIKLEKEDYGDNSVTARLPVQETVRDVPPAKKKSV